MIATNKINSLRLLCLFVTSISSNYHVAADDNYYSGSSSNLRSATAHQEYHGRELQFGGANDITSDVLNDLIENFTPELERLLRTALDETLDPVYIGDETTVDLGSFEIPAIIPGQPPCPISASAKYGLGTVTGLSNINIDSLALVPGSETIEPIGFLGLGGARWSATWMLDATFDAVTAETSASLKTESCFGEDIEQTFKGMTTLNEPTIQLEMFVGGETTNLFLFLQSSKITALTLQGLDFQLGTVDAGFALSGTIIPEVTLGDTFDAFLLNEFSDEVEPLILDALNAEIAGSLPIPLA